MLREFEDDPDTIVIADLEAGIGTLTRLREGQIDEIMIVCEPTLKSIQAATRAVEQAERISAKIWLIANRIRTESDHQMVQAAFPDLQVLIVPDDAGITEADRHGLAPIDHAPDGAGVEALRRLCQSW